MQRVEKRQSHDILCRCCVFDNLHGPGIFFDGRMVRIFIIILFLFIPQCPPVCVEVGMIENSIDWGTYDLVDIEEVWKQFEK